MSKRHEGSKEWGMRREEDEVTKGLRNGRKAEQNGSPPPEG